MPWTVRPEGAKAILHWQPDDPDGGEPAWTGWAEIFRGAPSWESNPELFHGLKALQLAEIHQPFLSAWTWDLPDAWEGHQNIGEGRKYLLLKGGRLDWSLVLRFSPRAPTFAFRELARAFNATPMQRAPAKAPRRRRHDAGRTQQFAEAPLADQGPSSRSSEEHA